MEAGAVSYKMVLGGISVVVELLSILIVVVGTGTRS